MDIVLMNLLLIGLLYNAINFSPWKEKELTSSLRDHWQLMTSVGEDVTFFSDGDTDKLPLASKSSPTPAHADNPN